MLGAETGGVNRRRGLVGSARMSDRPRTSLAGEQIPSPVRAALVRGRRLLFEGDDASRGPAGRLGLFVLRLLWLVVRSFFRDRLQIRASSLSFSTLLAIVPALALAFALARATGLYAEFRAETIDPFLAEVLPTGGESSSPGVAALRGTLDGVLLLVEETDLAGLGVAGVLVLVLALLRVVRGIEEAFRHVFVQRGVSKALHLRVRAFLVTMVVTPLGLLYSVTTASLTHGTRTMAFLSEWLPFAPLRALLIFLLPPLVTTLAIYTLYVELPQGHVRRRSALFGAVFAAIGWYGLQLLHVQLQVGLARWNAIYSGFGAFPVLLASIQASWVTVLVGAQLAAAHESAPSLHLLSRGAPSGHRAKQHLAMRAVAELGRAGEALGARALAEKLSADLRVLTEVLEALEAHRLLARLAGPGGPRWALTEDARSARAGDVLDALEAAPTGELPWEDADPHVERILRARKAAADTSGANLTIAELAALGESASVRASEPHPPAPPADAPSALGRAGPDAD